MIIALSQCFFYFIIIGQTIDNYQEYFPLPHYILACILTLIIASSGYIINDIIDQNIDIINHPSKLTIDKTTWIKRYVGIVLIGAVLHVILVALGGYWWYVWVYPVACFMLFLYSTHFKCRGIQGNLLVAAFSAGVVGILLVPLLGHLDVIDPIQLDIVMNNFLYYFILGFMISLVREMVKDIEDMDGDSAAGCQTLPNKIGVFRTKYYIIVFQICFLVALSVWLIALSATYEWYHITYVIASVILPTIFLIVKIIRAKNKEDYHFISTMLKNIMIFGILFLLIAEI